MTRTKKIAALICALVIACSLTLAGCGGSSSSSDSSSTGSDATAAKTNASWTDKDGNTYDFNLIEQGKLSVGSDCDYPPFIYLDGSNPQGFEYEMMAALADEMGLQLNYLEPQQFDTLITQVAANSKLDVAVSSFTITDERKQEVDFTDSYFDSNQAVVVMSNSGYTDYKSLDGLQIAAQSGTTGESWVKENLPNATVVPLNTVTDCMNSLVAGNVQAAVYDLPAALEEVSGSFTQCQIIGKIPTGEQYGIAVSKDNPGLTKALNAALAQYKADGGYDTLYNKYFSEQ